MRDQAFNNMVALGVAGIAIVASILVMAPIAPTGAAPTSPSGVNYLNLSIVVNTTYDVPQYVPANFSLPQGKVVVTITDQDSAAAWAGCACNVSGTVGGTEKLNRSNLSELSWTNVAHTFTVPSLGINVLSPGQSTVTFELDLTETGAFPWWCFAPCGSDGYTGFPMGAPGFMTGTMVVE